MNFVNLSRNEKTYQEVSELLLSQLSSLIFYNIKSQPLNSSLGQLEVKCDFFPSLYEVYMSCCQNYFFWFLSYIFLSSSATSYQLLSQFIPLKFLIILMYSIFLFCIFIDISLFTALLFATLSTKCAICLDTYEIN